MEAQVKATEKRTLTKVQRRVLGVLVEKAKTTPEQYPLTLNALTTGCNQKSNRAPQMNLDPDDVQICLDELRARGAVVEIQSGGRTAKFKHLLYDWLSVDKVELAVLAELLLRGAQTVGELRGRAARMEPIPDLSTLLPILESLRERQLLIELTPAGRGQVVSHNLYEDSEREALRREYSGGGLPEQSLPRSQPSGSPPSPSMTPPVADWKSELDTLREQVAELSERVAEVEGRLVELENG